MSRVESQELRRQAYSTEGRSRILISRSLASSERQGDCKPLSKIGKLGEIIKVFGSLMDELIHTSWSVVEQR
jgi:hypothetical protein